MRPDFLDRWSRLGSPVHRAPAGLKAGVALAAVVTAALVPPRFPGVLAGLLLLLVAVAAASRIPPGFLLGRLLLLEPLVLGIALVSAFQPDGLRTTLWIVARSSLCLLTMILLTNTMPFGDLLGLMRRLRVPDLLVTVLALMVRYLFVLFDEAGRLERARRSRTFTAGRARAWQSLAALAGQLFVRSTERAERIHAAMCARGWR